MFGFNSYALIGLAIMILGFITYFFWSQAKIEKQAKELVAYEITVKSQQQALEQLGVDVETIKEINKELSDIERSSAENASKLSDKLRGLEDIADEKPGIVEDLINNSSNARLRCFELATGAKPVKDEANKTCPHLLGDKK